MNGVIMGRDVELLKAITELSSACRRPFDEARYAHDLVRHSARLLDADGAGILLANADGELADVAESSETIRRLQIVQLHYNDGPGVVSYRDSRPVSVAELSVEECYGDIFLSATVNAGFSAVHALPLVSVDRTVGSLTVFRRYPSELDVDDRAIAKALTTMAAAHLLVERDLAWSESLSIQLETELRSRVTIEQAKGILAERHGLPMNSAFETMRSFATNSRHRLEDVARAVIDDSPIIAGLTRRRRPRDMRARVASRPSA